MSTLEVAVLGAAMYALRVKSPALTLLESVSNNLSTVSPVTANLLGLYLVWRAIRWTFRAYRFLLYELSAQDLVNFFGSHATTLARKIPAINARVLAEFAKVEEQMQHEIKGSIPLEDRGRTTLPHQGLPTSEILAKMSSLSEFESDKWKQGYVSGSVYHGGSEMLELQSQAIKMYDVTNPLHADMFPSLSKYEAEVIQMTASLLNGGDREVCGSLTSGGTESIFMAAKAHKEWARTTRGITEPEIVCADNAHAAIDKACQVLGIKLIHVPVDARTSRVTVAAIRKRMSADTIMIYSSAPSFPHGIIDPVEELGQVALEYNCGLHVDCCLGGFFLPFLNKLGGEYAVEERFDFSVPGVTSISVDTHKYGFAAKGTSVVLYRNKEFRHFQYFAFPKWTGGLYITPTYAGSRPGALIAAAWAGMMHTGENGYLAAMKQIADCVRVIRTRIERELSNELYICGQPKAMIVAFGCKNGLDIYRVGQAMNAKGWSLNMLQRPASAHICITLPSSPYGDRFVDDLKDCVQQVKAMGSNPTSSAPVYGVAATLPAGPLVDVLNTFLDVVYTV